MTVVALVDYGAGNMVSIGQALELVGATVRLAVTPDDLDGCSMLVVPGVGASAPAMARLRRRGLDRAIRDAVAGGAWYLGICLGLQLIFERSDEDGARMLAMLPGAVRAIPDPPRLPHIGWNTIEPVRAHELLDGVVPGSPAYFVHSYAAVPADLADVVAETEHGGRFASVVAHGRLLGVQFHPERSGADGVRILANAVRLAGGGLPAALRRTSGDTAGSGSAARHGTSGDAAGSGSAARHGTSGDAAGSGSAARHGTSGDAAGSGSAARHGTSGDAAGSGSAARHGTSGDAAGSDPVAASASVAASAR